MDTASAEAQRLPRNGKRPGGRRPALAACLAALVLSLSAGAAWLVRGRAAHPPTPVRSAERADSGRAQGEGGRGARGRLLYGMYCATCHGPEGHGDGPSAPELKPPPRDLAAGAWKHGTTPAAVRRVIAEGIPGTAMPASGQALAAEELNALTTYVLTLGPGGKPGALPARALLERAGFAPADGRPAPDLELLAAGGQRSTLTQLRGQVVLVVFWETACVPCLKKLPGLERLADTFRDRGLIVLPVCLDAEGREALRDAAAGRVKALPLYLDARGLARVRYGVDAVPAVFLIGRDGRLLAGGVGPRDWAGPEAGELMRACLAPPAER